MTYTRFNNFGTPSNWQEKLKTIKTARAEYAQYENIMTPYERSMITREIEEKRRLLEPEIIRGVLSEWNTALEGVKQTMTEVEAAKSKEARRWDAGKLSAEMQMTETLVNQAVSSSINKSKLDPEVMTRLQRIYQDAQTSGDLYKQRAAAEVFGGLIAKVGGDPDDRRAANRMAAQARQDAETTRSFDELNKAYEKAGQAIGVLNHAKETLFEVDEGLGYTRPNGDIGNFTLFKALARVKETDGGLEIVSEDQALG